jgi:hypothetical protein
LPLALVSRFGKHMTMIQLGQVRRQQANRAEVNAAVRKH